MFWSLPKYYLVTDGMKCLILQPAWPYPCCFSSYTCTMTYFRLKIKLFYLRSGLFFFFNNFMSIICFISTVTVVFVWMLLKDLNSSPKLKHLPSCFSIVIKINMFSVTYAVYFYTAKGRELGACVTFWYLLIIIVLILSRSIIIYSSPVLIVRFCDVRSCVHGHQQQLLWNYRAKLPRKLFA